MIIILVDVNHADIIITTIMNITTLVHADTEGLAHPITMITGGDTGLTILGIVIAMILKTIPETTMVDACADPHQRLQWQTLHNLAYSRCHILPPYLLPHSEVYNQLERANNPP